MPRLLLSCVAALLAACGQTGPLYLPDEGLATPVETRGPAAPGAAPAPPGASGEAEGSTEPEPDEDEPPGPVAP